MSDAARFGAQVAGAREAAKATRAGNRWACVSAGFCHPPKRRDALALDRHWAGTPTRVCRSRGGTWPPIWAEFEIVNPEFEGGQK
jgi:hypothetical protein